MVNPPWIVWKFGEYFFGARLLAALLRVSLTLPFISIPSYYCMIDLEFQATLNAISLPKIDEKTTVNEALSKFSEKVDRQQGLPAGTAKSAIKEAIPYSPVFGNRTSGKFPHFFMMSQWLCPN